MPASSRLTQPRWIDSLTPEQRKNYERSRMPTMDTLRRWVGLLEQEQRGSLQAAGRKELEKLEDGYSEGIRKRVREVGKRWGWLE